MNDDPKAPCIETTKNRNAEIASAATRQARLRMCLKLSAVLVALLAFSLLRWMEGQQRNYDEERARPIVIVDDVNAENVRRQQHDARLLGVSQVEKSFTGVPKVGYADDFDPDALPDIQETI